VLSSLRHFVGADFTAAVGQLSELVRIPAVAWASFDPVELDTAARHVAALMQETGIADVDILQAPRPDGGQGAPAVVGRRPARNGKLTLLLYAHYDVQPAGDITLWESPPFEAVERAGRLWGRGVADNKAGVMLHLAAFRNALRVLGDDLELGITLLIDGEEEAGSPSLPLLLQQHSDLLSADILVVADSGNWKVGVPALTTSLRGLILGIIEVRVLDHALHSGTYGGPLLDAVTVLSRLISTLHHDDGSVAVDGWVFSDAPGPPLSEEEFRADSGVRPGAPLVGTGSLTSRLWTKPALVVIGMDVPSVALSSDTLQPVARAKFSLSLAPESDTAAAMEAVRRHVEKHTPFGADVTLTPAGRTEGFAGDASSPAARAMLAAMEETWGVPAVCMGVGGSIPAVNILTKLYPRAEVLITGAEDPDSRAHGANESIHLGDFEKAILAEALLIARLNAPD
jgi:acetylornithine deacetylase/succinyl-diaminopimelate desuccinylase-like protein